MALKRRGLFIILAEKYRFLSRCPARLGYQLLFKKRAHTPPTFQGATMKVTPNVKYMLLTTF